RCRNFGNVWKKHAPWIPSPRSGPSEILHTLRAIWAIALRGGQVEDHSNSTVSGSLGQSAIGNWQLAMDWQLAIPQLPLPESRGGNSKVALPESSRTKYAGKGRPALEMKCSSRSVFPVVSSLAI